MKANVHNHNSRIKLIMLTKKHSSSELFNAMDFSSQLVFGQCLQLFFTETFLLLNAIEE